MAEPMEVKLFVREETPLVANGMLLLHVSFALKEVHAAAASEGGLRKLVELRRDQLLRSAGHALSVDGIQAALEALHASWPEPIPSPGNSDEARKAGVLNEA